MSKMTLTFRKIQITSSFPVSSSVYVPGAQMHFSRSIQHVFFGCLLLFLLASTQSACGQTAPTLGEMIRAELSPKDEGLNEDDAGEPQSTKSLLDDSDAEDDANRGEDEEDENEKDKETTNGYDSDKSGATLKRSSDRYHQLRKPLSEIRLTNAAGSGRTPENLASEVGESDQEAILVTASGTPVIGPDRYSINFNYRPLYYEQRNLERCGQSFGYFQNAVSGFQFLGNTMMLPYHMGQKRPDCPSECGSDCKTCQSYPIDLNPLPLDSHGLLIEMAAVAGFSFLLL